MCLSASEFAILRNARERSAATEYGAGLRTLLAVENLQRRIESLSRLSSGYVCVSNLITTVSMLQARHFGLETRGPTRRRRSPLIDVRFNFHMIYFFAVFFWLEPIFILSQFSYVFLRQLIVKLLVRYVEHRQESEFIFCSAL